jgi:sirohydrochlorin ferrochelatase
MKLRLTVCVALFVLLPVLASAEQGILLLTDAGTPEWDAQVAQLAAAIDKQQPTEVAVWSTTNPVVQPAVDRLIGRGVSEIVAVPLFVAAPPADLASKITAPVPVRATSSLTTDQVVADIMLGRAEERSANAATEVLVVMSHGASRSSDKRWVPDLPYAAQRINGLRRFAMILTAYVPPDDPATAAADLANLRRMIERQLANGRRIIVLPVLTPYGGIESMIRDSLQGLSFEVAKSGLLPDDRLVAWTLTRAQAK